MVVFTCNYCGDSLQKPKVEKHYTFTCRAEKFLTCVDCFKDFRGEEYDTHTKCVTEAARYSGKDFVQKANKGEVKQESWMEMIKSIILHENNLSPSYKSLLNTISYYNNVPRKRAKFINYIKSSTGGKTNMADIEGVWDIIEKYKTSTLSQTSNDTDTKNTVNIESKQDDNVNGNEGNNVKSQKKKRKRDNSIDENKSNEKSKKKKNKVANSLNDVEKNNIENDNLSNIPIFSFNDHILKILTEKETISKYKLYKKIFKKYKKIMDESITEEHLQKKVNKKLKKLENVVVQDDFVKLIIK